MYFFFKMCTKNGGSCETYTDGYYIESFMCVALGLLWIMWRRNSLRNMQNFKPSAWKVN